MTTSFETDTGSPPKGGTFADRKLSAMQAPVRVPWKGAPRTCADMTRPLGEKVTLTLATPLGSSGCLHPAAAPAAVESAARAAARSNSASDSEALGLLGGSGGAGRAEGGGVVATTVAGGRGDGAAVTAGWPGGLGVSGGAGGAVTARSTAIRAGSTGAEGGGGLGAADPCGSEGGAGARSEGSPAGIGGAFTAPVGIRTFGATSFPLGSADDPTPKRSATTMTTVLTEATATAQLAIPLRLAAATTAGRRSDTTGPGAFDLNVGRSGRGGGGGASGPRVRSPAGAVRLSLRHS
jgi:hypothetical protein